MSITRRYFLKIAAAAAAGATVRPTLLAASKSDAGTSAAERVGVAIIGMGTRGGQHLNDIARLEGVEVLYLCDADLAQAEPKVKEVADRQGRAPKVVQDFRVALDDPRVDAVTIASPNHWHALHGILAMQAGKHAYVEKPVSHNVWEGRQLAMWARRLKKVCQCGTQSRSSPSLMEAVQWVRDGHLGAIQYAIGTCYNPRPSIGKLDKPLKIPETVNYDLWCGPAAMKELYRPSFHYDWHWDFNTGNGDTGNQGIHQMDIARWFLDEATVSPKVMSIGGRLGYDDAGNTPNTQIVYHAYEKAPLIFETRGLPKRDLDYDAGMDDFRGSRVGVIIQCEQGFVLVPSYVEAAAFDNDGQPLKSWSGGGDHFANFFDAIRRDDPSVLNAEILEGHLSSALCHMGEISHRLGHPTAGRDIEPVVADNALWADSYRRMAEHLAANDINIERDQLTLGPWLEMDPETEQFIGNPRANQLLTREYRGSYVVPDATA